MIVSPSEVSTFKRCRRKWRYYSSNANNLEPFTTRPAFVLGTVVHKALGDFLDSHTIPADTAKVAYDKYITELGVEYETRLGTRISNMELQPLLEDRDLAVAMMTNYKDHWLTPLPENYTCLATEQEVKVAIPFSEHHLMMRLDALLMDSKDNIYVLEHKTYEQKPNPLALAMDEQFTAYVWGANQLGVGNVIGILYDGMWKRPSPPKGRVFEDLFNRQILHRSKLQLREFEYELEYVIQAMKLQPEYKTVPWNGCVDCAYVKLCLAETNREDVDYIRDTFYKQKHSRSEE